MSDTESADLGPMPDPEIEPGEPNPGGVDALPENGHVAIPDLTPEENPAVEDRIPDSILEQVAGGEDTSTKATRADDAAEADDEPQKESPA